MPERWLEIADEAGLLIQNEYFYWTKRPTDSVHRDFDADDLIAQLRDWMRDTWNHPSVVVFDASNETIEPLFAEKIIPAVRPLDLSRAAPGTTAGTRRSRRTTPVEEHLYEFNKFAREFPRVIDGMQSWPAPARRHARQVRPRRQSANPERIWLDLGEPRRHTHAAHRALVRQSRARHRERRRAGSSSNAT